jgi:hypothetical protein
LEVFIRAHAAGDDAPLLLSVLDLLHPTAKESSELEQIVWLAGAVIDGGGVFRGLQSVAESHLQRDECRRVYDEHAELILDAYDYYTSAEGGARGAVMLGDEMIDEASRKMALVISAKGRAAGMSRTQSFAPPEA